MKVNLRNTKLLFYLSVANILVCVLLFVYPSGGRFGLWFLMLANTAVFVFLVLTLIYFIRVFIYFNERTAVIAAFTMFTCLLVLSIGDTAFPSVLKYSYASSLGILMEVVSVLAAVRSFTVKAAPVSLPFKFLGAGIGLMSVPRLVMMLIGSSFYERWLNISNGIGMLIALPAICFILKRMMDFLKNDVEAPAEAVGE